MILLHGLLLRTQPDMHCARRLGKTILKCLYGNFTFKWILFKLCNALATFQRCMMLIIIDMVVTRPDQELKSAKLRIEALFRDGGSWKKVIMGLTIGSECLGSNHWWKLKEKKKGSNQKKGMNIQKERDEKIMISKGGWTNVVKIGTCVI